MSYVCLLIVLFYYFPSFALFPFFGGTIYAKIEHFFSSVNDESSIVLKHSEINGIIVCVDSTLIFVD